MDEWTIYIKQKLIATAQLVLQDELYVSKFKDYKKKKPQSNDIIVVSAESPDYGEYLKPGEVPSLEDYSYIMYFNLINTRNGLILDQTPKRYLNYIALKNR